MAADTETEIETEAMAAGATTARDSTMVMGMMILANEGISLPTTSGLLGVSSRFQRFLSPFVGVRHAISVSHFYDSSMGKPVVLQHLRQSPASSVTLPTLRHLSPFCNKLEGPISHSGALILRLRFAMWSGLSREGGGILLCSNSSISFAR